MGFGFTLRLAAIAMSYALSVTAPFAQINDYLGLPGPIALGDEQYELAWSSNPQDNYIKHEYVPAGQTVEAFEDMVIIETLIGAIEPLQAAAAQVENLNQGRPNDPLLNMDLIENEASGEALLDFLLSDRTAEGELVIEWNAYRYAPYEDGEGNAGILLFALSHRAYGEENGRAFLESLGTFRTDQIQALASAPLPEPAN